MTTLQWGHPENWIWLWLIPGLLVLFVLASARRAAALRRFGDKALLEKLALSLSHGARAIKHLLLLAAVAMTVFALAQPRIQKGETAVKREGIDVMIAVDVSNSMLSTDIAPSRLAKAKLELATLIEKLAQDRIGIVAFAGEAVIQCPLTLDKSAVKLFLSTVSPDLIPRQGTALANAIHVASLAFNEAEKDHKALILLTDGEDHEDKAVEAARQARKQGIRIFTIGIGTPDGSTVPQGNVGSGFKRSRSGEVVISKLNEEMLREIAAESDGFYYRASRGELELGRLVNEIRKLSQKSLQGGWMAEYHEFFQGFVALAFLFLGIELLISERKR